VKNKVPIIINGEHYFATGVTFTRNDPPNEDTFTTEIFGLVTLDGKAARKILFLDEEEK